MANLLLYADNGSIPSVTRAIKSDLLNCDYSTEGYQRGYAAGLEAAANIVDAMIRRDHEDGYKTVKALSDEAARVAESGVEVK